MIEYTIKEFLEIKRCAAPSFSPNGDRILFLNNDTGTFQIYITDTEGKEKRQLTFYDEPIEFASFSPVKNEVIFGMSKGGNEKTQFYLLNLDNNSTKKLTNNNNVKNNFGGLSRDGKFISYSSNERNNTDFDVYTMNIETGEIKCIFNLGGWCDSLGFSPKRNKLVISKANTNMTNELHIIDLNSNEINIIKDEGFDSKFGRPSWLPDESGFYFINNLNNYIMKLSFYNLNDKIIKDIYKNKYEIDGVSLTKNGKSLAVFVNKDGYENLEIYDTLNFKLILNNFPNGIVNNISWSNDGNFLAFAFETPVKTANIFIWNKENNNIKQLISARCSVDEKLFVEPELLKYKSFDGLEIPVFVYLPKGKNDKFPAIVYIHGGPEAQFTPNFAPLFHYFLYMGYAVICPNIRGSSGYGKKYLSLDDREKRFDSIKDLEYLYYFIKNISKIDSKKVALFGGSYGGYMVLAGLVFQPELWAAGIDIVGIANLVTFLQNTATYRRKLREAEYGYLDKNLDDLKKLSPINYVDNINAPLFVIHGTNDPRVPLSEAEQIVFKLKEIGREAILLVYDDEGHGLNKLKNRLDAYPKVVDFLNKYLKNNI